MAKKTNGERERFWQDLIGRQPASGLSVGRFCQQAGVSANSFFVWKRRLRSHHGEFNRSQPTSRRRLNRPGRSSGRGAHSPEASPLVPVRLIADAVHRQPPNAGVIEVEWPSGLVLRVPAGCDADVVRDVVKALTPLLVGDAPSC